MPPAIRQRADTEMNLGNYCRDGVCTDKYADDLQQPVTVNPVHVIKGQLQKPENLRYRCGGSTKQQLVHPKKQSATHIKKGHIAKVCRTKAKKHSVPPKSE